MTDKAQKRPLYRVEIAETGDVLGEFSNYRDAERYMNKNIRDDMKEWGEPMRYHITRYNSRDQYYGAVYDTEYGGQEVGYRPRRTVKARQSAKKPVKKKTAKKKSGSKSISPFVR